ncbi:hypothetical protein J32TS6_18710 [Virgibacillus pantothenticus]|uniref:hypothetical protein n=1 Tax=Virgibacillus pantothenticus TaxID=1473 RepID=UPI001B044E33|nr:hypothetical protein [Virgibacillus pantothenticus]GIP63316.1 hypothetical protein J32TS6_18710 [Virgibacillus pantothenticus]
MNLIYQKEKELISIVREEAEKIVADLVRRNKGRTTLELRSETLDYLKKNVDNERLSFEIKKGIDEFIYQIKIPTQSN